MTGTTPVLVFTPIVVVLVLAAWITVVVYAGTHPAWQRGAASGRGTADRAAGATPGRRGNRDGRSSRPEEPAAAGRDKGAHAEQAAETAPGGARAA